MEITIKERNVRIFKRFLTGKGTEENIVQALIKLEKEKRIEWTILVKELLKDRTLKDYFDEEFLKLKRR